MTHDELLAKIEVKGNHPFATLQYNEVGQTDIQAAFSALRAVVELHKPFGWNSNNLHLCCIACADFDDGDVVPASYPCPTIQAIEKELG